MRPVAAGLAALAALAGVGCESRPREPAPEPEESPARAVVADLPDALLVRFETVSGTALEREGWEIEILQMGPEIRVRGAVRTLGASAPIFRVMTEAEYADFWHWLSGFPIDRSRVEQDLAAPQAGWRKTCKVDVVLGTEKRIVSENRWTRPLIGPPWMQQVEDRLHLMALDFAEAGLGQPSPSPEDAAAVEEGVRRAFEALGEE